VFSFALSSRFLERRGNPSPPHTRSLDVTRVRIRLDVFEFISIIAASKHIKDHIFVQDNELSVGPIHRPPAVAVDNAVFGRNLIWFRSRLKTIATNYQCISNDHYAISKIFHSSGGIISFLFFRCRDGLINFFPRKLFY